MRRDQVVTGAAAPATCARGRYVPRYPSRAAGQRPSCAYTSRKRNRMRNHPCHEPYACEPTPSDADPRFRAVRSPPIAAAIQEPPPACTCRELHRELARAELSGEISELEALGLQAILAMAAGSEFAVDYLEMADAVASSPQELALTARTRAMCELLRDHLPDPAARAECLWSNLLFALSRVGNRDSIDAMRIAS